MSERRIFKILIISILFILAISTVSAADDTFTFTVGCKHITGNAGGGTYGGSLYIICDCGGLTGVDNIRAEYLVHPGDYYKIKVGEPVTLKLAGNGYCELNDDNEDNWW